MYDKGKLPSIADNFIKEINHTYKILEDIYTVLKENIPSKNKILNMTIVQLMTYLEGFNRNFFIELFSRLPEILKKPPKSQKDFKKLKLSYEEIIDLAVYEDPFHNYNELGDPLLNLMAEKLYNEVYNYERIDIIGFITKIEGFLELEFKKECKNRNINIEKLRDYRKIRNAIVHHLDIDLKSDKNLNISELKDILLNFIKIVKELTLNKFFPYREPKRFNLK